MCCCVRRARCVWGRGVQGAAPWGLVAALYQQQHHMDSGLCLFGGQTLTKHLWWCMCSSSCCCCCRTSCASTACGVLQGVVLRALASCPVSSHPATYASHLGERVLCTYIKPCSWGRA